MEKKSNSALNSFLTGMVIGVGLVIVDQVARKVREAREEEDYEPETIDVEAEVVETTIRKQQ